jgi:hypothetical protein
MAYTSPDELVEHETAASAAVEVSAVASAVDSTVPPEPAPERGLAPISVAEAVEATKATEMAETAEVVEMAKVVAVAAETAETTETTATATAKIDEAPSLGGSLDHRDALLLIGALVNECSRPCGTGSMSSAIYDTAWLAMLSRPAPDGSGSFWLFPESFQYILEAQCLGGGSSSSGFGGWPSYASQVDGILNTMAALLALLKHHNHRGAHAYALDPTLPGDIERRITLAAESLRRQLRDWDVESCDQVGFEILIPSLLCMLESEGGTSNSSPTQSPQPAFSSFSFSFPGRAPLMALHTAKMARFRPALLYAPLQTTAIHSLEAFVGRVDFDRLRHHRAPDGSLMASPASTAAYLMNCAVWDDDAERYLRMVVTEGAGRGDGSVPCAFPTTIFEITWVNTSTWFGYGFGRYCFVPLFRFLRCPPSHLFLVRRRPMTNYPVIRFSPRFSKLASQPPH